MRRAGASCIALRSRGPRSLATTLNLLSIERVEIFGVAIPLIGPGFKNAYLTKKAQKSALVPLTAADGPVGLGNIDPSPGYSTETIEHSLDALRTPLAQTVRGLDAGNPHRVVEAMDAALEGYLDAKAALEMA